LDIDGVDANSCIPAFPGRVWEPVFLNGATLSQQDDDTEHVREDEAPHHDIQAPVQDRRVLDAEDEDADGTFEQADVEKEKDLGHPSEKVDINVVVVRQVRSVPPIAMIH
jgi:hypothetical protein